MRAQEKQKASHLVILICYTIFTIVLTAESLLLGWQPVIVLLLLAALTAAWVIHITDTFTEHIRLWVYFVMSMLAYVFYGIHETSMYDLAPVMIFVIIVYSITEKELFITLCVSVYFLILLSVALFVLDESFALTPLMLTRTLLHCALVYTTGRLTKIVIRRRHKERSETEAKIAALKDANRRTEDFLTNVSHELRTPAAVLKGSVEMLLSGAVRGETETAEYYAQMQRETEQLSRLINDLLDLSRLQNEQFRLEKETFDLHDVARDAVRAARRIAAPKSVRIVFKSTEKDCTVLGDYGRIRQLLLILLDNAVKFSPEGAEVSLSLIRSQDAVSACVRDNGSGIAPEALPHVFDRFYRASNTERTGGTGLGLAIARQIAERHGAHITAESADGETRFTVVFHVCRLSGE